MLGGKRPDRRCEGRQRRTGDAGADEKFGGRGPRGHPRQRRQGRYWLELGRGARHGLHGDLSQHARRRRLPTQVVVDTDVDIVAAPTRSRPAAAVKSAISRGEAMTTIRGEGAETLLERAIEPIVLVDRERLFLLTQVCHTTAYFHLKSSKKMDSCAAFLLCPTLPKARLSSNLAPLW